MIKISYLPVEPNIYGRVVADLFLFSLYKVWTPLCSTGSPVLYKCTEDFQGPMWGGGGGGYSLIYELYRTGMCSPKGYGFSAVLVINRVLILAYLGHFCHKWGMVFARYP